MISSELRKSKSRLEQGAADAGLVRLYGETALDFQRQRYLNLLGRAEQLLGDRPPVLASAPGRTELGGNHTDHNNGRVLASAVDLDCIGFGVPADYQRITIYSDGHPEPIRVELNSLTPQQEEEGTPQALIRGVAAARAEQNRKLGGFSAVVHSTCKPGTGLSSSAAFSVLIGGIFAALFDQDPVNPIQLARDGRFAENHFFGKPCGLMDQLSSALGQTLGIDFAVPENPQITHIESDFKRFGYQLLIIDTGGSHSSLTPEYAAVTAEIGRAVRLLGAEKARGITIEAVLKQIHEIRRQAGDRALLRLLHFIAEDQRAAEQTAALQRGDWARFLRLVKSSGNSSCRFLQNCSSAATTEDQGLLLAMALTEQLFPKAFCRVHGGGFAGTVQ
ncbi:MAG: galactokinase family protein, partial [Desulfofustis sp.]